MSTLTEQNKKLKELVANLSKFCGYLHANIENGKDEAFEEVSDVKLQRIKRLEAELSALDQQEPLTDDGTEHEAQTRTAEELLGRYDIFWNERYGLSVPKSDAIEAMQEYANQSRLSVQEPRDYPEAFIDYCIIVVGLDDDGYLTGESTTVKTIPELFNHWKSLNSKQ